MLTQTQLFPPEIIENTTEAYLPKVSVKGQVIYSLAIFSILALLASLPFIYVNVSVQSEGIIRTVGAFVAGTITKINAKENANVSVGDELYVINTDIIDSKLKLNFIQQNERNVFINDLTILVNTNLSNINFPKLLSPLYSQQFTQLKYLLEENSHQQAKIKKELDVDRKLYQEKVIAMRELDEKEYAYKRLQAEYKTTIERQMSIWQAELSKYKFEKAELMAQNKQTFEEKEIYTIKAPVAGTIQQLAGKYIGSTIQPNESLGIISPDSNLLVECYISPKDIGFIRKNQNVSFQIHAFNYNEWGLLTGKVENVANDFIIINEQPVFKILCILDKKELSLKNGYIGKVKKGMSLRARFSITDRSLYQLLYDKVDDWINPKIAS
jgi:membrane fusion protein, peptide pheromone/bacteriocin exporter